MFPVPGQSSVVVYRRIGRDGIQPGGKGPVAAEPAKLAEHLQPHFLDAILRLRGIQNDPVTDSMNPVGVAVVQRRRRISVTGPGRLDQGFIWNRIFSIRHSHNTYELANKNEHKKLGALAFLGVLIVGVTLISDCIEQEDQKESPKVTQSPETPKPVTAKAEIVNHSSYMYSATYHQIFGETWSGEFLHIVGEIQNISTVNIRVEEIDVVFYDA